MSRQNIIIFVVIVVIAVVVVVFFATPDQEEKATAAFEAAYKIEQTGKLDQAIVAYQKLIDDYAGTEAGKRAKESVERITGYKARVSTLEARKVLDRLALVLNGYREMLGTVPASIKQLDSGEYMFDSDYMADIPPEGYTCYVVFEPVSTSFTLFSYRSEDGATVRLEANGKVAPVSKEELDREVGKAGLEKVEKGRVVFLQPAS